MIIEDLRNCRMDVSTNCTGFGSKKKKNLNEKEINERERGARREVSLVLGFWGFRFWAKWSFF